MGRYEVGQGDDKLVKARFILFCNINKISQTDISVITATPLATVNRWFNENIPTLPSLNAVFNLTIAKDMSFIWLMTGEGEMCCRNNEFWDPVLKRMNKNNNEKQTVVQADNIGGNQTAVLGKSCEHCPLPKVVEKLTDKLMEKI